MRIVILFFVFLIVGGLFIISNQELHLADKEEALIFGETYYNWILGIRDNVGTLTGYVVGLDWLPDGKEN
jgi:hypothetical protein